MDPSLFSVRWYRVASLKPRLPAQVELKRQAQRGVPWYLLVDLASDTLRRLNRPAYQFVGRCDGIATVQQIWDSLLATAPDDTMTQDELVDLLVALHGRGLLQFDLAPDVESIFRTRDTQQRKRRAQGVNPLAFRIALGDPSRLLARGRPLAAWLFCGTSFLLWFMIVASALLVAAMHAPELGAYAAKTLGSPGYLFLGWLMYPLIKAVHESAHALAVERWGGRVRQLGLSLLMLTPVPFVNASAADGFRHRHQRAVVSAAGIMAELLIAALALGVWLAVQPGTVRDLAFLAMFIGGMSTVLTNGNPLMRFDGYYLFCDLLDLRNLAPRSARWWSQWLSRRVLGIAPALPLETLPGERFWLVIYAPLSWCYRAGISLAIAMWIGGFSSVMGVAIGCLMLGSIIGRPLWASIKFLRHALVRDADRARAWRRAGLASGALALLITVVPIPFSTIAEGVVWLPEKAQLRAETEGFVSSLAARDGQQVKAGDLIATLQDDKLIAERATHASEATELEIELFTAMQQQPEKVPQLREKLDYSRAEVARIDEKISHLEVRAQADGVLVMPDQADMPGSFRKKGELIAHLLTREPLIVRVALPQQEAGLVRSAAGGVGVRLAEEGHAEHASRIALDMPGTVDRLPSAALGDRNGGPIAVDNDDKDGLATRSPVVLMDVEVMAERGSRVGGRALVRFDHGLMPIGGQAVRKLQQLLLNRFNPAA